MTGRRHALIFGLTALSVRGGVRAQPKMIRIPTVGLLVSETLALQAVRIDALRAGLRERGYDDDRTVRFEIRSAEGLYDRLPALAAELVRLRVDLVVAFGIKALAAVHAATTSIPIVIPATSSDLVAMGLASSLAHPGGNITGSTTFGPEIMAKRLELLKEVKAAVSRVAVLVNPANASFGPADAELDAAAKSLKVSLSRVEVKSPGEFEAAFAAMERGRVEALVLQDDTLFGGVNAGTLARLASVHHLPAVGGTGFADAGGALGYGRSDAELDRRGAYFVERILKGARPADLPIEQASRFELVINLRAMKALAIPVVSSLQLRAARLIE